MDNKDYQKLAAEFINMWQKQLQTMVTDKQFVENMFASLQQMANYANPSQYESQQHAPTSDALHERLGELDFRLRMVEQRLEKLESSAQKKAPAKPATRSRKRTSAKKT